MKTARILTIAGRIVKQFGHDLRTMALLFVVPILVMSLMGYLMSENKEPVTIAYVDADGGLLTPMGRLALGEELGRELKRASGIEVKSYATAGAAEAAVRAGKSIGAVIVPAEASAHILAGEQVKVRVLVKGIDPSTDRIVMAAAAKALAGFAAKRAGAMTGGSPPVTLENKALQGRVDGKTLDYFAPAFIVGFAFFFTFLLTSVSFLRERSSGTMERLAVSPASKIEVMLGYLLGFLLFSLVQTFLILAYSVWVLHVHVAGSIFLVMLVLALMVIGVVNLGISLSFLARNELQVIQFIPVVLVPQIFLGGLMWPLETLHPSLRALAQIFPLTHAAAALRQVMLAGAGFADIQGRLWAILAFAVAAAALGAAALHRERA
ncbi:MAG: ABC transporter permease [Bacteroidota bacterium]